MKKVKLKILILISIMLISINFISSAITIISPANSTNFTGTAFFNITYVNATDITDSVNATILYNSSSGWTSIGIINCTNSSECNGNLNISSITNGFYIINATLNNGTSQISANVLSYNVNFDSTAPLITLISPEDGTQDTDGVVRFTFNVSDFRSVTNCSLYYQSGLFSTINSITNNALNTIEVTSLNEGSVLYMNDLQWYIKCTDDLNNIGNSSTNHLDTIEVVSSSGGSGGGSITTENLNPKYVSLNYPKEWETNSKVTIKIQSYNLSGALYNPESINFNIGINGISFEKFSNEENGTIIATFNVINEVELGSKSIEVIIKDQRTITQTITFEVVKGSSFFSTQRGNIFGVDNTIIYLIGGGLIFLVIFILIIIAVLSKDKRSE